MPISGSMVIYFQSEDSIRREKLQVIPILFNPQKTDVHGNEEADFGDHGKSFISRQGAKTQRRQGPLIHQEEGALHQESENDQ